MTIDPKQVRVKCPTCAFPLAVTVTMCHVCGGRVDPRAQWEVHESNVTRTQ